MANYHPAYPTSVSVDRGIKEFITAFYSVSDTPGKNKEWADFFRDDATLAMEKKEATGRTDILQIREGMWEKVEARKHTVFKVFPASFESSSSRTDDEVVELALFGSVAYRLKTGAEDGADWAGTATLVRTGGAKEWKFAYYRVYLQR